MKVRAIPTHVLVRGHEIGAHEDHLPIALLVGPFPERMRRVAVGERRPEDVGTPLPLGEAVGATRRFLKSARVSLDNGVLATTAKLDLDTIASRHRIR